MYAPATGIVRVFKEFKFWNPLPYIICNPCAKIFFVARRGLKILKIGSRHHSPVPAAHCQLPY